METTGMKREHQSFLPLRPHFQDNTPPGKGRMMFSVYLLSKSLSSLASRPQPHWSGQLFIPAVCRGGEVEVVHGEAGLLHLEEELKRARVSEDDE